MPSQADVSQLVRECTKNGTGFRTNPAERPAVNAATNPIRICHVSMCLQTGGLERLLVDFSRLHDREQFELQFAALTELGQPAEDIRNSDCRVSSLNDGRVHRVRQLYRLMRLLRRSRIDVVHTHNTYAHFYGALAAKLAGVPVVVNTQHGRGCGQGWKAKAQFRIANRFANRIVGVSQDAANLCRDQDQRAADRITTIWNGIDLEKFTCRGPSDKLAAISVSRLSPEKDLATLLKAVAIAAAEVPDFRLKIVGDGREKSSLQTLARQLGIDGRVEFLGERRDVPDLLAGAGFFVSSSLTEGISLTLLEAMAVGLPIVATSVGGNPEVVVDGETGWLVPAGDAQALAAGIVEMCHGREAWQAMGLLGRRRVEQHFDIRKMVGQYESLYRELLGHYEQPDYEDSICEFNFPASDSPCARHI